MKPIQLIVLGVAVVAALGLALVARNMMATKPTVQMVDNEPVPIVQTVAVLVANEEIPQGSSLQAERLTWQEWPLDNLRESFITQNSSPDALEEYSSQIARASFFAGEPIREQKLVQSESGYLSAILPAGKRAVAIRIQADTSAGGFILPNDHVDVIMSYQNEGNQWLTDTVLTNVRVLAIDTLVEEKEGEKNQIGETATLELSASQAEILSVSSQISGNNLTLALRSVRDTNPEISGAATHLRQGGADRPRKSSVRVIRFGHTSEERIKN